MENIDFVVTWGDGNDPDWQREKDGGQIRTDGKPTTQVGIVTGIFALLVQICRKVWMVM